MIIDTSLRVSLRRHDKEIDCFVAHSGEGAIELCVEMLRQLKELQPDDTIVVQALSDYLTNYLGEDHARVVPIA